MMNRTDAIVGSLTLLGVVTVSGLTYYFLQEPVKPIQEIQPVSVTLEVPSAPMIPSFTPSLPGEGIPGQSANRIEPPEKRNIVNTKANNISTPPLLSPSTASAKNPDRLDSSSSFEKTESIPTLPDVYFDFDRGGIPEEAKSLLKSHAQKLKHSKWVVLIQGHTDSQGSIKHNLRLGFQRAETVKHYLVTLGIPSSRIEVVSLGEFEPICTEEIRPCQQKNRRVHFALAEADSSEVPPPRMSPNTPETAKEGVTQHRQGLGNTPESTGKNPQSDLVPPRGVMLQDPEDSQALSSTLGEIEDTKLRKETVPIPGEEPGESVPQTDIPKGEGGSALPLDESEENGPQRMERVHDQGGIMFFPVLR